MTTVLLISAFVSLTIIIALVFASNAWSASLESRERIARQVEETKRLQTLEIEQTQRIRLEIHRQELALELAKQAEITDKVRDIPLEDF